VCGLKDAHSSEFAPESPNPVVIFMPEGSTEIKGGTMRLGSRCCNLREGTLAWQLYEGYPAVYERHRHRYEVNPKYVSSFENAGLVFSGIDDHKERMEMIELPSSTHPFFLGLQAHPEFKSRPLKPSPPFHGLILASAGKFTRRDVARRHVAPPTFAASSLVTSTLAGAIPLSSPVSGGHSPTNRRGSDAASFSAASAPPTPAPPGVAGRAFLSTPHSDGTLFPVSVTVTMAPIDTAAAEQKSTTPSISSSGASSSVKTPVAGVTSPSTSSTSSVPVPPSGVPATTRQGC
jgi:hypothetical protein